MMKFLRFFAVIGVLVAWFCHPTLAACPNIGPKLDMFGSRLEALAQRVENIDPAATDFDGLVFTAISSFSRDMEVFIDTLPEGCISEPQFERLSRQVDGLQRARLTAERKHSTFLATYFKRR